MTVPERREADAVAELAASRAELTGSVTKMLDFSVAHMDKTPAEASAIARAPAPFGPAGRAADQVTWSDLTRLAEHEPEAGTALWRQLKEEARREL